MTFPTDALNERTDLTGNVSSSTLITVPNGSTYSVLYESFNTSSKGVNASLIIGCGNTTLLRVNDFSGVQELERFKMAKCTEDIKVSVASTTGSPITTVNLIYTPYDVALATSSIMSGFALDNSGVSTNLYFTVVLLLAVAIITGIDLLRRLFIPKRKL